MVQVIHVEGYEECVNSVEKFKNIEVYILFSGSLQLNGKSWCPDCVVADPVVHKVMTEVNRDIVFITCGVGDRQFWKDKTNIFRTSDMFRLTAVPTLVKYKTSKRLVEGECADEDLVKMMLEED